MEISFTQFRVYTECPWKYKLLFQDRKRIPLNPSSSLGLSLHKALECFHRSKDPDLDALLDCLERRWVRAGYPSAAQEEAAFERASRILERYYGDEQSRRTQVVGIEREFFYPLGRHTVRGMIDRVDLHPDGGHEVIDYKTRLDPDEYFAESARLQLRFYALGLRECLAVTPTRLTVHYLASGQRETRPYDPSGEEELKAAVEAAADRIEKGDFRPDTGFCSRCDFRLTCTHSAAKGA